MSTKARTTKEAAAVRRSRTGSVKAAAPAAPIDLSRPTGERPLTGSDVLTFLHTHRMPRARLLDALAISSPQAYGKLTRDGERSQVPMDLELLLRYYLANPPQTRRVLPVEAFTKMYGPLLAQFEGSEGYDTARVMLYARFAALLGRTVFSCYRWFERGPDGKFSDVGGPLRKLLSLVPDDGAQMREVLENLARTTYRVRGQNFDIEFPLPDPGRPPSGRRFGPEPGGSAERNAELGRKVAAAVKRSATKAPKKEASGDRDRAQPQRKAARARKTVD